MDCIICYQESNSLVHPCCTSCNVCEQCYKRLIVEGTFRCPLCNTQRPLFTTLRIQFPDGYCLYRTIIETTNLYGNTMLVLNRPIFFPNPRPNTHWVFVLKGEHLMFRDGGGFLSHIASKWSLLEEEPMEDYLTGC